MRRRVLGKTGLSVSEVGFGCGPGARLMVSGDPSLRLAVVRRALEHGIDYFDTAAFYGDGLSESHLGEVLTILGASPLIATKVTLSEKDLSDIDAAVSASVAASLTRLRRNRVDVVHLHNRVGRARASRANIGAGVQLDVADVLGPGGAAEALERLQARGLVGAIGCCAFGGEMDAIQEVIESGRFGSVLVNSSALNNSAWIQGSAPSGSEDYRAVAAVAADRSLGVVALRILEAGALSGPVDEAAARNPAVAALVRRLPPGVLGPTGDLAAFALRFALSNPAVSTALVGISDLSQLEAAVAAAAEGPLPDVVVRSPS